MCVGVSGCVGCEVCVCVWVWVCGCEWLCGVQCVCGLSHLAYISEFSTTCSSVHEQPTNHTYPSKDKRRQLDAPTHFSQHQLCLGDRGDVYEDLPIVKCSILCPDFAEHVNEFTNYIMIIVVMHCSATN